MSTSIWWIRRDLRLSDNQALAAALGKNQVVIPVFILDPRLIASSAAGQNRLAFLFNGLRALDTDLWQKDAPSTYGVKIRWRRCMPCAEKLRRRASSQKRISRLMPASATNE